MAAFGWLRGPVCRALTNDGRSVAYDKGFAAEQLKDANRLSYQDTQSKGWRMG